MKIFKKGRIGIYLEIFRKIQKEIVKKKIIMYYFFGVEIRSRKGKIEDLWILVIRCVE